MDELHTETSCEPSPCSPAAPPMLAPTEVDCSAGEWGAEPAADPGPPVTYGRPGALWLWVMWGEAPEKRPDRREPMRRMGLGPADGGAEAAAAASAALRAASTRACWCLAMRPRTWLEAWPTLARKLREGGGSREASGCEAVKGFFAQGALAAAAASRDGHT